MWFSYKRHIRINWKKFVGKYILVVKNRGEHEYKTAMLNRGLFSLEWATDRP